MAKLNENDYVSFFLRPDQIINVCTTSCDTVRQSCRCPNERLCKELFNNTETNYYNIILHERQKIWKLNSKVSERKAHFLNTVMTMVIADEETLRPLIMWRLNGKLICKSFYKVVSGIPQKMFDSVVASILSGENTEEETVQHMAGLKSSITKAETYVIAFLDNYFKGKNVETAPDAVGENTGKRYMRYRWKELYDEEFMPMQKDLNCPIIEYFDFCRIRKLHRPQYQKHRKIRTSKKWGHLECPDCIQSKIQIRKASCNCKRVGISTEDLAKYELLLRTAKEQLKFHYDLVQRNHNSYAKTIVKAITNKHCDISMNIDAAGTAVMGHGLFFKENVVVGQPASFTCLKTKNTFVTVHGWGNIVFQSYPEYEEQEIIFRAIRIVMKSKKMRRLRNLYLQFDKHSVNKNFTVISACGALTLLGMCRKVKASYGQRGHGHNDGDARMGDVNRTWL